MSPDPDLVGVRGLFGPEGIDAVASFLSSRSWSMTEARPVQALYRPGRSAVVRYKVVARDEDGRRRITTVCAESRTQWREPLSPAADFKARFGISDPVGPVGPYLLWAFPYDPGLKGLADAADGRVVRDAMSSWGERPLVVDAQPLRYRPRRRAVFRYWTYYGRRCEPSSAIRFGKVLRSHKAGRALEVGDLLAKKRRRDDVLLSLPVGAVGRNTLVFEPMAGHCLRDVLVRGGSLPHPERVLSAMDGLAALGLGDSATPRRDPIKTAHATQELLGYLAPGSEAEVAAVVHAVENGAGDGTARHRITHGDLYEAQVFMNEDFSLGLIDLDDVGPGDMVMDGANLCAHLLALGYSAPSTRRRLLAYRALTKRVLLDALDVSEQAFAWREALVMLQLATGPFRVLNPRWPEQVTRQIQLAARLAPTPVGV